MEPATAAGLVAAEQVISTTVEGGAVAAYGLSQPTLPLSATFHRLSSEAFLPRLNHSLTIVAGQAYIIGGEVEQGRLAGDEVHIVSLPLKGAGNEGKPDYKCVPSLGEGVDGRTPGPRAGHTAVAIEERIYVFGGRGEEEVAIEEMGRIWVFDTATLGWTHIDPADDGAVPPSRYHHACVASEHPLPQKPAVENASYTSQLKSTISKLPSLVGQAAPSKEPHGTLIISSGLSAASQPLNDTWAFNLVSQTWHTLPPPPTTTPTPTNLALVNDRLYTITHPSHLSSSLHFLPLIRQPHPTTQTDLLTTSAKEWSTLPIPTNPLTPGPQPRKGAGLIPITTGNGREYLLYIMGAKDSNVFTSVDLSHADSAGNLIPSSPEISEHSSTAAQLHSDAYALQLPSQATSFAALKDGMLSTLGFGTNESTWAEVVLDTDAGGGVGGPSLASALAAKAGELGSWKLAGEGGVGKEGGKEGVKEGLKEGVKREKAEGKELEGKAHPGPRALFALAGVGGYGKGDGVVLWGGINGAGGVEGDGWVVRISVA